MLSAEEEWAKKVTESLESIPHHLENHTLNSIQRDMVNIMRIEHIHPNDNLLFQEKLNGYRYVGDICDLFRGRHIRWIRLFETNGIRVVKPTLTNGGIVTDIQFRVNGIYIQCKNTRNQFMLFPLDSCIVFQKLTAEECLVLMVGNQSQSI
jgi:hypothetical protein